MPVTVKIELTHLIAVGSDLFAIDKEGLVWKRSITNTEWQQNGELPNKPTAVERSHEQLHIDAPDGLDEDKDK